MEKNEKNLWKKVIIGFLIILVIFLIFIARKFIIIKKLTNVSKENVNKTNYIVTSSLTQNGNGYTEKSYNKDGNFLTKMKFSGKSFDDIVKYISYKNGNDELYIVEEGQNIKTSTESQSYSKGIIRSMSSYFGDNIMDNLKDAIMSKITSTDYYNGKKCYLIQRDNLMLWVDKTTGLVYRQINGDFGVTEFIYEFDTVTDNDIKKP